MSQLSTLDVIVVFGYLGLICGIGAAFYRKHSGLQEYFVAGRQIPAAVVVIGLAASYTSSISYLGVPSYAFRANLVPLAGMFAAPAALWIVAKMFLPFFFKLNVITCYEYLDLRFGPGARLIASVLFLVSRVLWLVLVCYGTAVALKYAIPLTVPSTTAAALRSVHVDPEIAFWVVVLGALGATYTMLGGMKAVMWTDLLQFFMLCFGLAATLVVTATTSEKNLLEMWRVVDEAGRTRLFDFRFSWFADNFWAALAGGFFIAMSDQGLDQIAAQRYLSAKSLRESQRSAIFSLAVNVPLNVLLYSAGLALFVLYGSGQNQGVNRILQENPDALLTYFFFDRMPAGVLGLMLATILAATLSCLTAGINSLAASTVVDIYQGWFNKKGTNEELTRVGRRVTVGWAAVVTLGAAWAGNAGGGVMEISYLFLGLAASLNLGIFLTAMLIPRASERTLYWAVSFGAVISIIVVAAGFHWLWFSFFGGFSILAFAACASRFLPPPPAPRVHGLTWWTRTLPMIRATAAAHAASSPAEFGDRRA